MYVLKFALTALAIIGLWATGLLDLLALIGI